MKNGDFSELLANRGSNLNRVLCLSCVQGGPHDRAAATLNGHWTRRQVSIWRLVSENSGGLPGGGSRRRTTTCGRI